MLSNKVAVVTGANGGIGFQTALGLAKNGASVFLACRDRVRGEAAVSRIKREYADAVVELLLLDLSCLSSVKTFAETLATKITKLDLLVNNAAIMAIPERKLSADGYEMQFATNHLGHFALSMRLSPLLANSQSPRVVTVSSIAHRYGKMDFDNLQGEKNYEGWQNYGTSKLANLLFAFELGRRSARAGLPLISLAAHPGVAKTNILASGPRQGNKVLRSYVSDVFTALLAQSDAEGALPVLMACQDSAARSGLFYGPDGMMQIRGRPTVVQPSPSANDESVAAKLWGVSENLTHLRYEEVNQ